MYISSYCNIKDNSIYLDGNKIIEFKDSENFLKDVYLSLNLEYPKFYKMDKLAKLAVLSTEYIVNHTPELKELNDGAIALLFSNNNSSAQTDENFLNSYENKGNPSPALFVYTLPNILMGEIAIKHKWYGENMFTVSKTFNSQYFAAYPQLLLNKNAEAVLCGWIDISNKKTESFLFLVTKKDFKNLNLPLNSDTLEKLI